MKANVQIEFTDEEVERYIAKLVFKGFTSLEASLGSVFNDPQAVSVLQTVFGQLTRTQVPQPQGGWYPPPWARSTAAPAGVGASVTRMPNTNSVVDKCFAIEETRHMEAGWGCCRCATYNGVSRAACRYCGHERCGVIVTPPPSPQPNGPQPA